MLSLSYIVEYTLLSMALNMHSNTRAIMIIHIRFHLFGEEGMGKQNEANIFSLTDTHCSKLHPFLYPEIGREADILKLIGNNIKT